MSKSYPTIETVADGMVVVVARSIEEAQQVAADAMSGNCTITSVERVREGGIGGFFATELVRVVAKPSNSPKTERQVGATLSSAEDLITSLRGQSPQFADRLMAGLLHPAPAAEPLPELPMQPGERVHRSDMEDSELDLVASWQRNNDAQHEIERRLQAREPDRIYPIPGEVEVNPVAQAARQPVNVAYEPARSAPAPVHAQRVQQQPLADMLVPQRQPESAPMWDPQPVQQTPQWTPVDPAQMAAWATHPAQPVSGWTPVEAPIAAWNPQMGQPQVAHQAPVQAAPLHHSPAPQAPAPQINTHFPTVHQTPPWIPMEPTPAPTWPTSTPQPTIEPARTPAEPKPSPAWTAAVTPSTTFINRSSETSTAQRPIVGDGLWSHHSLRAIGLPDRIVDQAQRHSPSGGAEWIIALMEAFRVVCTPQPVGPTMLIGPACANLARQLRLVSVSNEEAIDSGASIAIPHATAQMVRATRGDRYVHLMVGGAWQHLGSVQCQIVSAATEEDLLEALRVCSAWGATLGWFWAGDRYQVVDEFTLVAHVRAVLYNLEQQSQSAEGLAAFPGAAS